jgi:hypothetical protein
MHAASYPPVASKPRWRCMKEGEVGIASTLCLQLAGTALGGSRGSMSQRVAFETTALRAAMEVPLRSLTPASQGSCPKLREAFSPHKSFSPRAVVA